MEIQIPNKLSTEIEIYCKSNKIDDINVFILKIIKKGFDIEKWGDINFIPEESVINISKSPLVVQDDIKPTQNTRTQDIINKQTTRKTISKYQPSDNIYGDDE
jgi:hypothetical protein